MSAYFILLSLILLLVLFGKISKNETFIPILIMTLLVLFSGFRYNVGTDYNSYEYIYDVIKNNDLDFLDLKELGFIYIVKILCSIGATSQSLFLVCAVLTQFSIYKFVKKFSVRIYWSILVYLCIAPYYFSSFNGVRQSLSIAMFLFSLNYLKNNNILKYSMINIFSGFFFHASAFFMLPFYFFLSRRYSFFMKIIILVAIVLGSFFFIKLLSFTPYEHYTQTTKEYEVLPSIFNYIFLLISFIVMILERYVIVQKWSKNVFFNMNVLSLGLSLAALLQGGGTFYMLLMRINNYFFSAYIILIPMLLYKSKFTNLTIIKFLIITLLLLYFLKTIVDNGVHYHLIPYQMNFNLIE